MTAKPNLTLVTSPRPLPDGHVERNPGIPLDLDVVRAIRVNRSAVERRAATLSTRRTVKKEWQAAWLLRAITLIDLTTLSGDDTPGNVRRLCAKARHPLRDDITTSLGVAKLGIKVGAVCVYHSLVRTAVEALEGSGIPVAAVSTGFPAGLSPIDQRVEEIRASVAAGAREIDIVITRAHVLTGNYEALYDEVRRFREACGHAHMKAILATGELATLGNVARASMVAMQAGADFIKTSTGKEGVNATIPFGVVMCRMIRGVLRADGFRDWLQAGRRHSCREERAGLSLPDEGRARRPLAQARPLSLWRELTPHRHRAPARAFRDRPVRRGAPHANALRTGRWLLSTRPLVRVPKGQSSTSN
jgi:deoxyribose-phosphate aldolase